MATSEEITSQRGSWVFIAPIKGLSLAEAVNYEFKIDRVTFVSAAKLPRVRKRLGFPYRISEFRKRFSSVATHFFDDAKTFATMRLTGKGNEQNEKFLNHVREALWILSLSQLGYSRRRINACPVLAEERSAGRLRYLMMNAKTQAWNQSNEVTGKIHDLLLDKHWLKFQDKGFFASLLNILNGKTKISGGWKKDIRNATLLAGQSQCSSDLPQSFLWNMISLETLLTTRGDTYSDRLPERVEAFLGWTTNWRIDDYERKVREIYKKRCGFVHAGKRETIQVEDVLFIDMLLLNIFLNVAKHPNLFRSKESLIAFSEKVQAERTLGIRPRVRPRTMTFWNPRYGTEDYKRI